MSDAGSILIVNNITAGYGEGAMVADASFTLASGEILCLVGESGCGKSTLLKAVMGTAPGLQVLSGELVLDGQSLLPLPFPTHRGDRSGRRSVFSAGYQTVSAPLYHSASFSSESFLQ